MEKDIKEIYAIAMNCIVVSLTLVIVSLGMNVKNSYAVSQNNRISQQKAYQQYLKYGTLNETEVTGSEAISVIREFYADDGVVVYMDKDNSGRSLKMTKELARQKKGYINNSLQNTDISSIEYLENAISSTSEYTVWVVYDGMDPSDLATMSLEEKRTVSQPSYTVSGIALIRK